MRVHVIGGGLAGLSAALEFTEQGRAVTLYEASKQAGGRCRSYFDRELGCTVDNGNHLLLSGNRAAFAYLDRIGARGTMGGPGEPFFPFLDRASGRRWTVRPSRSRLPWWIFFPVRRVPDTRARDYLGLLALRRPPPEATVAAVAPGGVLYDRLIEPLAIAALNTRPEHGLAALLGAVMRETLLLGGAACVPSFPRSSLAESFIDPALAWLAARGAQVRLGQRIAALRRSDGRVATLETASGPVDLAPADWVVMAVPPWVATDLLPGLQAPDTFEAILNIHFRISVPPGPAGFIGLIGGVAEWVFVKPGHVSVTISAASRLIDQPGEAIAAAVWPDVCAALGLDGVMPPWRVVKERRATFAATAAQERLRPQSHTPGGNLLLAGDWVATGLPGTIEGAIRSGRTAAHSLLDASA